MNTERIKELWGEATGSNWPRFGKSIVGKYDYHLKKFAKLIAAEEREACAKVCENIDVEYEGEDVLATWCAAAIRARGNDA